jgi:integrase
VQLDEGIRVQPVATGAVPPIDNDDLGIGMLKQGVDEPHPECACTDHEVVSFHVARDYFTKLRSAPRQLWDSGLPLMRLHDLRHTHATLLLKARVPIKVVSERLRHSTPGFIMPRYQDVPPGCRQTPRRPLPPTARTPLRVPRGERV